MSEHLSWLVADEVAAGLARAPEHAASCTACTERLKQAADARASARAAPEFERTFRRAAVEPRRAWVPWLIPATAFAAALALAVFVKPPVERLKGGATIEVRLGDTTVTAPKIGSRVSLWVGAAGHPYGIVVAVEADGKAETVWSGAVPRGASAPVGPRLEVTPGRTTLLAFFADAPLTIDDLSGATARASMTLEPMP